jgi:ABC-type amino acid transport system permease subunit
MEQFFHELWVARWALAQGLLLTVEISLASILCGTIIGLCRHWPDRGKWPLRLPVRARGLHPNRSSLILLPSIS